MTTKHAISVELPADLYKRIQEVAERSERSVETVLLESLAVLFGASQPSPETLEIYSDEQLWGVVYQRPK